MELQAPGSIGKPMGKTDLLWQSQALVNRDEGLFDNLPWEWVGPGEE